MDNSSIFQRVAEKALTQDNILGYLDMVCNNLSFSTINQCLIYEQKPDAKIICGRKAWEAMGRTIKEDAKPIYILFPSVQVDVPSEEFVVDGKPQAIGDNDVPILLKEAKYKADYLTVACYDLDATSGKVVPANELDIEDITDAILDSTGGAIETVDEDLLDGELGKYEEDSATFYISNNIRLDIPSGKETYIATLLSLFIAYTLNRRYRSDDIELQGALEYILLNKYNLPCEITEGFILKNVENRTVEEKIDFLKNVTYFASSIAQDMEGAFLSFNETALVNDLLYTSEYENMWISMDKAIVSIEDEELVETIRILKEKLMRTVDGTLEELCSLKADKKLFSYPPKLINIDKTDYIKQSITN